MPSSLIVGTLRIEGFLQSIPDERERQHRQRHHNCGEQRNVIIHADKIPDPRPNHLSPTGGGFGDANAKKAQPCLRKNRQRHGKRERHDQGR